MTINISIDFDNADEVTEHSLTCPYERCAICSRIWFENFETDPQKKAFHKYITSDKGKLSVKKSYLKRKSKARV